MLTPYPQAATMEKILDLSLILFMKYHEYLNIKF